MEEDAQRRFDEYKKKEEADRELQFEARTEIFKRVIALAEGAAASQLKDLAEAYVSVLRAKLPDNVL